MSSTNRLKFYFFHLMPYPHIPPEETLPSTWVTLSNKHYDPRHGHRLYNEYLNQLVDAERYGFDGVIVNEHHANAYGTMPAPDLIAAYLVARTNDIPIGIIGNAIPLHGNPLRIAEEIAMLDVISGGRIISGFVRGLGCEYFNNAVYAGDSIERFWEAHDLIIKAWTEDGPFTWQGDHYYIPNVNPWPRPMQQPHPPIWIPGYGSLETITQCAKRKYTYMGIFAPQWFYKASFGKYREEANKFGYEASKDQLMACLPTYVAETDAQAEREAKAHMSWLFNTGLKFPGHLFFPPGYMTKKSMRGFLNMSEKFDLKPPYELSYSELLEQNYMVVGSPETVIEKYSEYCEDVGAGGVICAGSPFGPMPDWMVKKNMQMFAEEVMPKFRDADGKPAYMKEERPGVHTLGELHATAGKPDLPALSRVEGIEDGLVDHRTAHLPENIDAALGAGKKAGAD